MRLLLLTLLSTPAASLLSQAPSQATITLEIDISPPQSDDPVDGDWIDASTGQIPVGTGVKEFRLRITGTEGGWCFPVLGLETASAFQNAPAWLVANANLQPANTVNWYGCQFPVGDPTHDVWRKPTFQFFVDAALGAGQDPNAVGTWCQPFLTQQYNPNVLNASTRLWTANPPLWPTEIKALWMGLLEDIATGAANPRMTAFSGGAALRQALLLQSYLTTGGFQDAIDFLNSGDFTAAVDAQWFSMTVQPFAFRAAQLPIGTAWTGDGQVPKLVEFVPPPKVGMGKRAKFPVIWPEHSGSSMSNIGSVAPEETFSFLSNYATPPVFITFPTATGVARRLARARPTLELPGRYECTVPADAVAGQVLYQADCDQYAIVIGQVSHQLGQ